MAPKKRKTASARKTRSENKLDAAKQLLQWLAQNKGTNIPQLREWMKAKAIPGFITNLINNADLIHHCHSAVKELASLAKKKRRQ